MKYEIEKTGKFVMIHIVGDFSPELSTKVINDELEQLMKKGEHHIVFNLEKTTYLDSSGIGVFVHCLVDANENGGSVYLIAEEEQVLEILSMVGIDSLMTIYKSKDDFLADQGLD